MLDTNEHHNFLQAVASIAREKVRGGAVLSKRLVGACFIEALEQQEKLVEQLRTNPEAHAVIARAIFEQVNG